MTEKEIHKICRKYKIQNYNINSDMRIDVDDDVIFYDKLLTSIPLNFRSIEGNFDCSFNMISSLKGCPSYVGGFFDCRKNTLKTLQFCPKHIEESFACCYNQITSLRGGPRWVGGFYDCFNNQLYSLKGIATHIGDTLDCRENLLDTIEHTPEYVGGDWAIEKRFKSVPIVKRHLLAGKVKGYC